MEKNQTAQIIQEQQKEFTGVWIPRHVLEDTRLKPVDRLLYAEIACFSECWQSNETLAVRSGTSVSTIKRSLKLLQEAGYVLQVNFNGRSRTLKVLTDKPVQFEPADRSKWSGRQVKMTQQTAQFDPLDNNIDNKEIIKRNTISEVESEKSKNDKNEKKLLEILNNTLKREFRVLPHGYKKTLEQFTLEEIQTALANLAKDSWHSERLMNLKIDYLLRATTIDKFRVSEAVQKDNFVRTRLNLTTGKMEEY